MTTHGVRTASVVSLDGTRIAYRRVGAGPPVVVMHGTLGTSISWLPVARRLADRFELFLVDRRGRGGSGDGTAPHSLGREVDDAFAVLRVAGPDATLLGHSYGGAVALEAARVAQDGQIGRLVVYEPGVAVAGLVPGDQIARIEALVQGGKLAEALDLALARLDAAGLVHAGPPGGPRPDALLALARTLPREIRAVDALGPDLARYATITQPALLLAGAASPERQRRNCEALAAVLPDAGVAWLEQLGHVAHNAAPDLVAGLVGSFLEAQLSQAASSSSASGST